MKLKSTLLTLSLCLVTGFSTYFLTNHTASVKSQVVITDNEYQVAGVLYMQTSAEYRALCYQAFNVAKMYLDDDFEKKNLKKLPKEERKKPRAVVVDIDETVLDNSPAQAYNILNRRPFELKSWYEWGEMRRAKAIPGAVDFLKYANSKGIKVFYVSNRDEVQKKATIDNLKAVGFPDVSEETVLLRQKDSSKKARREAVSAKYRIVILGGDNLNDMSEKYEKKPIQERFQEVENDRNLWGTKYIVLPNAMYGDWENAIYDYQRLSEEEKAAKRKSRLETF